VEYEPGSNPVKCPGAIGLGLCGVRWLGLSGMWAYTEVYS